MRFLKRLLLVSIAILLTLFFFHTTNPVQAAIAAQHCGAWNVVHSPNAGKGNNNLSGVVALSTNNVWAVGSYSTGNGNATLTEHWNGSRWSIVPSQNVAGATTSLLNGVAAFDASHVWAVGAYYTNGMYQTLIERWDGRAWHITPSPNEGADGLSSVAVISKTDAWAVGTGTDSNQNNVALIEHWNGKTWSIVPAASLNSGFVNLFGITVVSATDAWAVGNYNNNGVIDALTEHWDGKTWSAVLASSPGLSANVLNSISATSTNDVWAAGDYTSGAGPAEQFFTLIEHWNGKTWNIVSSANTPNSNTLSGVSALSPNNIWAVGEYRGGLDPNGPYFTLIEHWNGKTWSIVSSPNPSNSFDPLNAVAGVLGTTRVWAAGSYETNAIFQTMILAYC